MFIINEIQLSRMQFCVAPIMTEKIWVKYRFSTRYETKCEDENCGVF